MRFRKRVKIAKGLYLNFSGKGTSVSVGGGGLTMNVSKQAVRVTTSIPGTGFTETKTLKRPVQSQLTEAPRAAEREDLPASHLGDLAKSAHTLKVVEGRQPSTLLWLGIFFAPHVASWFTLQKGYSRDLRKFAFGWLGVVLVLTLISSAL